MEASIKAEFHVRSISFPSQPHPITHCVQEQIYRIKASLTSSSSSQISCHQLRGLKELYDGVDDFLQLSLAQKSLSGDRKSKDMERLLEGEIMLLDLCGKASDVFSQMRGSVHQLQSSLRRRRRCGESGVADEIRSYVVSSKRLNKEICMCLGNLKRVQNKCFNNNASCNEAIVVNMLQQVGQISAKVFESLLHSVSHTKTRSIVSKLMQSKGDDDTTNINEVVSVHLRVLELYSKKPSKQGVDYVRVQNLSRQLEALGSSVGEVEEELECVFRRLLKTRVSLLNILSS